MGFSNDYVAILADINQRMPFARKAAEQFDNLLRRSDRQLIEHAILDIAAGRGCEESATTHRLATCALQLATP
ncbi:hypothetical protein J2W17_005699 [Pseudomonas lini]|uniref:hypothetical protein n=1 Tax=Pseudomonas lini TaxID=163011 RepID=UPI002786EBC2|nr:hypothetical protein [Pseudomonas lini]MDQ0126712.1 hypothetical protein [Pseudomonas lini]